jgi:hypothetical protein
MPSNEDHVHQMYEEMQKQRELAKQLRFQQRVDSNKLNTFFGRQPYVGAAPRSNDPSFRSIFFNVGEGLLSLEPQETAILAKKTVPSQHAGVMTGFSQYFGDCDIGIGGGLENLVLWKLRINDFVPQGFMDFVGQYSSLMLPHSVYFPLAGGAATLGTVDTSVGGSSIETTPTVTFSATNYHDKPVTLQGRIIGYTFPTAERDDEFANI